MSKSPNYMKGAAWGAFFALCNALFRLSFGLETKVQSLPYYGGTLLGGAIFGVIAVKIISIWRPKPKG